MWAVPRARWRASSWLVSQAPRIDSAPRASIRDGHHTIEMQAWSSVERTAILRSNCRGRDGQPMLHRILRCVSKTSIVAGPGRPHRPARKVPSIPKAWRPVRDGAGPTDALQDQAGDVAGEDPITSGMAGRYATALFDLARDERALDAVRGDLDSFEKLLDQNPDLNRLV